MRIKVRSDEIPCGRDYSQQPDQIFSKATRLFAEVGDNAGEPQLIRLKNGFMISEVQVISGLPIGGFVVFNATKSSYRLVCIGDFR
jgi:hypothetical protein